MAKGNLNVDLESGNIRKADLINILHTATSSSVRNKAVKLLRKFDPKPRRDLDHEANDRNMKLKSFNTIQAFMCFRCDRVKQTKIKGIWQTSEGSKAICSTCHNALIGQLQLAQIKAQNKIISF